MKNRLISDISYLLLRLGLGFVFLYFGSDKLINLEGNAAIISSIATSLIPFNAKIFTILYGIVEILVGSALILGFFVKIVASLATIMISLTLLIFWLKMNIFLPRDIALITISIFLIINGGGRLNLDKFIRWKK